MTDHVLNTIIGYVPELIAIRRDIHAHPEVRYEEVRTAALVATKLREWGVDVTEGVGGTGVVGTIRGERPAQRSVVLRADMDALDIEEKTGLPYASRVPGKMHACGHDGHTAMLLGAGRYLASHRDFGGIVHLVFQPAEEGGNGALAMVQDGLFDRFPADAVYGLHNAPTLPKGSFGTRKGPMFAAADSWSVVFRGTGGHGGSAPHLSTDPTIPLAHFILGLQAIIGRNVPPSETAVLSVGHISGGERASPNIIPSECIVAGTARSYSLQIRELFKERLKEVAMAHASASNCTAELSYQEGCPPVVNQEGNVDIALQAAADLVGGGSVDSSISPRTAGDDISFMFAERPGAYMMLGAGPSADGKVHNVHTPFYDFNDDILAIGSAFWVKVAHLELNLAPP